MMGQLSFDLRLSYERNLKDNLINVTTFAGEQMKQNFLEEGRPFKTVESEQEAYGVLAQQYVNVCGWQKQLKSSMDDFLKALNADGEANQITGTTYNAAIELAQEAVLMAAQAVRILKDLYYESPKTPLEEYAESVDMEGDEE